MFLVETRDLIKAVYLSLTVDNIFSANCKHSSLFGHLQQLRKKLCDTTDIYIEAFSFLLTLAKIFSAMANTLAYFGHTQHKEKSFT